jgi:hypothetical protein
VGYAKFMEKYKAKKIIWNSNQYGSYGWNGFIQCTQASRAAKAPEGLPGVKCLVCSLVLLYLVTGGIFTIKQHIATKECQQA